VRNFFLILALFGGSFASNMPCSYAKLCTTTLGPNIEYGVFGAVAPAEPKGAFVPRSNANFEFSWIEPLGADYYGVWIPNKTNYISFFAGADISPFYGAIKVGLGFAPFPPPFAVLEIRFGYSNENLFLSDVEMPMRFGDQPSIKDVWNTSYMFDRFYESSSYAQIQSFDTQLGGRYDSRLFSISFLFHFALIDITSDYDKKSFDHMRGIPLYSRDYVVAEGFFAIYNFSKSFSWGAEMYSMFSGRRFQFYSPFKSYSKEPLYYYILSTGPIWRFNEGKSQLSIVPGFFTRGNEKSFDDSIKERILLSVQYKHFWNFRFGKSNQ
jgi:hypothetical protein